ncbi:restriction endonuclease subunit S [Acinetobacter lwoffii]|uniref:restriction endonuclease subunit S n=1 Tax=Acinetobacter lwoffii TaxID=28090 RepID=UPI00209B3107|nr:restriction endonuclease subunit S [Acinetobacter lwoffii]MCO8062151.1 restriction endonuclease subunit S [Acinetobacter lwoffii]
MNEQSLLDLVNLTTGKLNSNAAVETGKYPFFTCSPETLSIDQFSFDTKALLLAGNNAEGNFCLKYYEGKFDAYQRTYVLTLDDESVTTYKYLFYYLKTKLLELKNNSAGSATKFLTLSILRDIRVPLPPLPEQKAIASVLSSLDDKIDLLHRQNKTLEAMAETLFRQWFIEEAKEDWIKGKVEDLFTLQRGYDLPSSKRIKGEFPLYAASGLNDMINAYQVEYPTVITGRSGSIGGVYISLEKSWPLNTTLFIKEFKLGTLVFSYFYLKYLDLESFNAGSAVPSLNRNHVHGLEIQLPPSQLIKEYEEIAQDWMLKVKANKHQIQTLENLRDTLLPKLMSGEVRVQYQTEEVA